MSTEEFVENIKTKLAVKNDLIRCMLSEFLGTFILVILSDGAIAGLVITETSNHLWAAFGVGLGVAFGIWTGFGVSGGHVNPAVSIGLLVTGKFPLKKFPFYCVAQYCGAFIGSVVCFFVYYERIIEIETPVNQTSISCGIFTTFPADHVGYATAFFDQIITAGLLMGLIMVLLDKRNSGPDLTLVPFFVGIIVFSVILSYGVNTGAPLNPARDLAGRMMCVIANFGPEVWVIDGSHWWLIPTFGPLVGSVVGAWIYMLFIEVHHPPGKKEESRIEIGEDDKNDNLAFSTEPGDQETSGV